LLASSVDPTREAATWADQVCKAAGAHDMIIVLGLGCGYHVTELLSRRPRSQVIVIESDQQLCDEAFKISPELYDGVVIVQNDWTKLIESQPFRDAVGGIYHIAIHGPTSQLDADYIQSVDALLRGRDKLSFLLLLKARPELVGILDPEAIAKIGLEPVTIKTVTQLFGAQAAGTRERRLWRVLEELVL
jgi:hypothetical protein